MSALVDRSAPTVIASGAEGCILAHRGAVVAIRRAPVDARYVADLHRAHATAVSTTSGRTVALTIFRLSPDFPVGIADTKEPEEYVAPTRELDRVVAAYAMVTEFGGVRAMGIRAITRAVWSLARPRCELGTFDRLTHAIDWVAPRAQALGALDEAAEYVRLYRAADQILDSIDDAARARR